MLCMVVHIIEGWSSILLHLLFQSWFRTLGNARAVNFCVLVITCMHARKFKVIISCYTNCTPKFSRCITGCFSATSQATSDTEPTVGEHSLSETPPTSPGRIPSLSLLLQLSRHLTSTGCRRTQGATSNRSAVPPLPYWASSQSKVSRLLRIQKDPK